MFLAKTYISQSMYDIIYINIFIFQTKKNAKWRLSATSTWNRFWCRVVFLVQRSLRLQSRWKVLPLPPGGEATFDGWGKLGRCFPFQIWATTGTASTERFELRSSMRQKTFLRRLFRGWLVFVWLHVVEYLDRRTGRFDRERPVSFHCWQVTAQKCRICWAASGKCFSPRFLWNVLRILDHSVVVSWKTLWADLSFCRSFCSYTGLTGVWRAEKRAPLQAGAGPRRNVWSQDMTSLAAAADLRGGYPRKRCAPYLNWQVGGSHFSVASRLSCVTIGPWYHDPCFCFCVCFTLFGVFCWDSPRTGQSSTRTTSAWSTTETFLRIEQLGEAVEQLGEATGEREDVAGVRQWHWRKGIWLGLYWAQFLSK